MYCRINNNYTRLLLRRRGNLLRTNGPSNISLIRSIISPNSLNVAVPLLSVIRNTSTSSTPAPSTIPISSSSIPKLVSWLRNNNSTNVPSLSIFQCHERIMNTLSPSLFLEYMQEYLTILSLQSSSSAINPSITKLTNEEWNILRETFFIWIQDNHTNILKESLFSIQDINSLIYILSSSVMYLYTVPTLPASTSSNSGSSATPTNNSTKIKRRNDTLLMDITVWKSIVYTLGQRIIQYYDSTLTSSSSELTIQHLHLWYMLLRLLTLKRLTYPEYIIKSNQYIQNALETNPSLIKLLPLPVWSDIIGSLSFAGDRNLIEKLFITFSICQTNNPSKFLQYLTETNYKDGHEYLLAYYRKDTTDNIFPVKPSESNINLFWAYHSFTWMLKRAYDTGISISVINQGLTLINHIYPAVEQLMKTHTLTPSPSLSSSSITVGDYISASTHLLFILQQIMIYQTSISSSSSSESATMYEQIYFPLLTSISNFLNTIFNKDTISAKSLALFLSTMDKAIQSQQYRQQNKQISSKPSVTKSSSSVTKAFITKDERTAVKEILGWDISFNPTTPTYYFPSRIAGLGGMLRVCLRDNLWLQEYQNTKFTVPLPTFNSTIHDIGKLWNNRTINKNNDISGLTYKSMFEDTVSKEIQIIYQSLMNESPNNNKLQPQGKTILSKHYESTVVFNKVIKLSNDNTYEIDIFIPKRKTKSKDQISSVSGLMVEIDGPFHYIPFSPQEMYQANIKVAKSTNGTIVPVFTFDELYDNYSTNIIHTLHTQNIKQPNSMIPSPITNIAHVSSEYETYWNSRRKYSDTIRYLQIQKLFISESNKLSLLYSIPFWHPIFSHDQTKLSGKSNRSTATSMNTNKSWSTELQIDLMQKLLSLTK